MADEAPGCGDDDIGTERETTALLLVADAVVAAIDGYAAHGDIVGEALHSLVDLLGQLTRGRHDDAVDGILGVATIADHAQDGEQVGCCLARTGLSHADEVASLEQGRYRVLLDGGTGGEVHRVECIEHVVIEVEIVEVQLIYDL